MRPAASVILLTTLIGAGQGLFLALFTVQAYALVGLLPAAGQDPFYAGGSAIALGLLVAGLLASFFHLGRPERARRSAAQWRTSWLSREVIVLPAFMATVALYGGAHAVAWAPEIVRLPGGVIIDPSVLLGVLGTMLAFALFICTGMVYAYLRFLAEWHSPLTLINYTLLGGASGFVLAAAWASLVATGLVGFLSAWAVDDILAMDLPGFDPAALGKAGAAADAVGAWHDVMATADLGLDGVTRVECDGRGLFIHHGSDGWKAFDSRCPHQTTNIPHLALSGNTLTCPKHEWAFDIRSGRCTAKGDTPLTRWDTKIVEGRLLARW